MATDIKPSIHNPFRSHPVTPEPTGIGPSTDSPTVSAQSDVPPRSESRQMDMAAPAVPGSSAQGQTQRPARQDRPSADDLASELQATLLDDNAPSEPPPAYTPSANPYEGEATVEYGPRRPFQPARPAPSVSEVSGPNLPLQHQNTGRSQGSAFMTPQATGMPPMPSRMGTWGPYPGRGTPSTSSVGQYGPPPRHPQVTGTGQSAPIPPISINQTPTGNGMSDFARDFYIAGSGRRPSPAPSNNSSSEAGPEHYEPVRRTSAPSTSYPPPQGAPPTASPSSSTSPYAPPSGPPPPRASSDNTDELRPTTTPTPGRPLLNKGRVLIYPNGFQCKKCLNTGYKSFDPSHPCRKCWDKHSKPYSGAIVYAPHSPQFQRPLPNLKPPHQYSQSQFSLQPPPASSTPNLLRSQSAHRPSSSPWGGYPGRPSTSPYMSFGGRSSCGFVPPLPPRSMATPQLNFTRGLPPPGSVVVQPGDPRIGGRLCWRCDGSGTVSFMIFDVEQCPICNGVGRVFQ